MCARHFVRLLVGKDGFDFDDKDDGKGGVLDCPAECVLGVAENFQPYARALMRVNVGGWANQEFDREVPYNVGIRV